MYIKERSQQTFKVPTNTTGITKNNHLLKYVSRLVKLVNIRHILDMMLKVTALLTGLTSPHLDIICNKSVEWQNLTLREMNCHFYNIRSCLDNLISSFYTTNKVRFPGMLFVADCKCTILFLYLYCLVICLVNVNPNTTILEPHLNNTFIKIKINRLAIKSGSPTLQIKRVIFGFLSFFKTAELLQLLVFEMHGQVGINFQY